MADGKVVTGETEPGGLVVSTGILGDLVLPIGAFNPDRADEAHKLQRSGVGQSFATNPS